MGLEQHCEELKSKECAVILFGEVMLKAERCWRRRRGVGGGGEVLAEAEQGSVGGENLGVVDQRVGLKDNMTKNGVANIGGLFRYGHG